MEELCTIIIYIRALYGFLITRIYRFLYRCVFNFQPHKVFRGKFWTWHLNEFRNDSFSSSSWRV